ncbi:hypothetical protein ACFR96_04675 [Microbulbifer halophilus]|uniref:Uncharacterized protein n=1 Tax=Microbulbifer halophilus TaxID=453963 RepID=A0ABW5EBU4_9GAMM|nr:hypothetical protein [Microbulbifer halophilus]MCW8127919.1 hypothetical protein [Microbulbifer halophilus]
MTTNDMLLMIRTSLGGGGITFGMEKTVMPISSAASWSPCSTAGCRLLPASVCIPRAGGRLRQS